MTTVKFDSNEIRWLCEAVFGRSVELPDDLRTRVEWLCQSMRDEIADEDDEDLDREWAERLLPDIERWLYEMVDVEMQYEGHIEKFWSRIQADSRLAEQSVPNDPLPTELLRAILARLNDVLEAEMPDSLLAENTAMLYVDQREASAWWDADDSLEPIDLREVIAGSVSRAPDAWTHMSGALTDVLLEAVCVGTLPLTGFQPVACVDGVQRWKWTSPEAEFESPEEPSTETVEWITEDEDAYELWSKAPALALQLEIPLLDSPDCFDQLSESPGESFNQIVSCTRRAGLSQEQSCRVLGIKLAESIEVAARHGDRKAMASRAQLIQNLVTME